MALNWYAFVAPGKTPAPILDRWMVEAVVSYLAAQPGDHAVYFINLSGKTVADESFLGTVCHLLDHYGLHGEQAGVRSARKHIGWAVRALPGGEAFRAEMNLIDDCAAQLRAVESFFDRLADTHPRLPAASRAANDDLLARQA